MSDPYLQSPEGWQNHRVTSDGVPTCDCGHPITYHLATNARCGYSPPHSHVRCRCRLVTTIGVARNELYSKS